MYPADVGCNAGRAEKVLPENVTLVIPALSRALKNDARKPSGVQGCPSKFVRIMGLHFGVAPNRDFRGVLTGIVTRAPVFDCFSRMYFAS